MASKALILFMVTIWSLLMCLASVKSCPQADRISSLPGQPKVDFQQFSGYITVDEKQQRALFYYFVEAETEPASKPLVLWFNGGPGCSSVGVGAFIEHGPFMPRGKVLVKNEYSWNKEANMLYLESPVGVGFSYSVNQSYQLMDDNITARDNLAFLELWFEKFPEYKNRDFFITGESYAGHYVPQLAKLILKSKAKFNLKGIAIGNPLLDFNRDYNSKAEYLWSHGLISDATYEKFTLVCNYSTMRRQEERGPLTPICDQVYNEVFGEVSKYVDQYDVALDKCAPPVTLQSKILRGKQHKREIYVCVDDETHSYLNRIDVQKALHARLVGVGTWEECSDILKYDMQNLEVTTVHLLGSLVKSGIRVLVFSGDQDSVIPLISTRKIVNQLSKKLALNTTVPYTVWLCQKQVCGWTQEYGKLLTFATIRGASHEAPFSQPERSIVLFSSFLAGKQLPRAIPPPQD